MTEKNFNNTNSSIKKAYYINNEFKGEEKMTNRNCNNTDGRHFANTDNTQNFDDLGKTRTFVNLYSSSKGYERNAELRDVQNRSAYDDNYTEFNANPQPVKPPVKKKNAKAKVVAIVMASIAAASARFCSI